MKQDFTPNESNFFYDWKKQWSDDEFKFLSKYLDNHEQKVQNFVVKNIIGFASAYFVFSSSSIDEIELNLN